MVLPMLFSIPEEKEGRGAGWGKEDQPGVFS